MIHNLEPPAGWVEYVPSGELRFRGDFGVMTPDAYTLALLKALVENAPKRRTKLYHAVHAVIIREMQRRSREIWEREADETDKRGQRKRAAR